ncbi:MAG: hypothetical protein Q4G08_04020 [Capnocytophaga sp.]|nr:hypothetical protein [Capnocytophaga sp.]
MKYFLWFLVLPLWIVGCKQSNENTEALMAEKKQTMLDSLVQNQFATIDMNTVDSYPLFDACSDTLARKAQQECFQSEFSKHFQALVKSEKLEVTEPISDTVVVYVKVDNQGNVVLDHTEAKDHTRKLLPDLDQVLIKHFEEFPDLKPATKQGIEVNMQFAMPLVLNVK